MSIKHILFDNDGTIVDSEIIGARIMLKLLAQHGLHMEERIYNMRFPGLLTRDIIIALQQEEGFIAPANFIQQIRDEHLAGFHRSLRAIRGMPALFRSLKVPKSMVSNGSIQHVEKCLRMVRLRSSLDGFIFSAEQVDKPKPFPDVYLFALEKLGLSAHETLVIEDSVTGILAAKSAGIQSVGFLGAAHIHDGHGQMLWDAGADFVVADAEGLTMLLKKKGAV
ncbi:MAG: HAD family phosphatase [Saprospiraceae bacterium]|nr:HAD family phosphatase [Saprospiraceae bacterium]